MPCEKYQNALIDLAAGVGSAGTQRNPRPSRYLRTLPLRSRSATTLICLHRFRHPPDRERPAAPRVTPSFPSASRAARSPPTSGVSQLDLCGRCLRRRRSAFARFATSRNARRKPPGRRTVSYAANNEQGTGSRCPSHAAHSFSKIDAACKQAQRSASKTLRTRSLGSSR
jgi:hypothetical protein